MTAATEGASAIGLLIGLAIVPFVLIKDAKDERSLRAEVEQRCAQRAGPIVDEYEDWQDDFFRPRVRVVACGPGADSTPYDSDRLFSGAGDFVGRVCEGRRGDVLTSDTQGKDRTFGVVICRGRAGR